MTATETRWKRLIVRWTAPKGFAALLLFFVLTLIIETISVLAFQTLGLVDQDILTATFLVPYVNWTFSVSFSLLFHLLPFSVILVLLSSWVYVTKHTAFVPQRIETAKRVSAPPRRAQEGRRFRSLRQFTKRLSRRLQRVGRVVKNGVQKIRGVSYISQRLFFARAAVRSAVTVLMVFLAAIFLIFLVENPDSIRAWTVNLYRGVPALRNFVVGAAQWLTSVGLAGLGSAVNNALIGAGPGFRQSLEGAGASFAPIAQLDLVGKYVLSQNFAAWTSAIVALVYSVYASSRPSRRPKGR